MWNRVVGQIGQAWNQNYPQTDEPEEPEETGVNGVSSTQSTSAEGETVGLAAQDSELTPEQYRKLILAKESEASSVRTKYDTLYSKFRSLHSSYDTDLQAERSVIEALKDQIMERDKEQTEAGNKAESKFNRLKKQARTRINELSKEIDALKLGQEANGKTSFTQEKVDESLTGSPSSSRAGSPDRLQHELCEKESELESAQQELAALRRSNIELDNQLSELQQQIAQLQPIKNELKTSLASFDRIEQENAQLNTSIQDLNHRNSQLNSRINEVIEERKQSEENLDQFKKYKLKEFQEVIHNKSDELEALNNSQSLLRLEYIEEKQKREQQASQLSSLREEKELSRQRYQQLVLQVEGYTKEIEQLKAATGREETQESSNDATQVNELKAQLRESREETEMKREDILSKDCELNSQEEKLEEALLKNDKLSEDIDNYVNLLSGCKLEMDQTSSLNTELEGTVNALRKEVEEAETLIDASQTDLNTCTEELEREQCLTIEIKSQLEEANIREIFSQERISYLENSLPNNTDSQLETEESTQLSHKLKNENQILNAKLEKAEEELSNAKQNLEEELSLLRVQADRQSKEIDSLNTLNSDLTNEKLGLENKLGENQSLESAVTSQNEQIALKCSEIDNLNKSIISLRDENEIMRDQNSSVQSELEQIVGQLNVATDNNRQLTEKLNTKEEDVLLAQQSNGTLQQRVSLLEGQRVELESLRETSATTGVLEQQLYSSQEECKQFKLKNSEQLLSIESLSTENKQIKSALDKSTQSINSMRLSLDAANSGNNKLTSDIDRITRENSKINSNVNSLIDELSQLRDQLNRKDSELSSLLKTTQAASSEINLLRESITARDRECSGLKEQNSLLGEDAKRMQEGFDSALELIQSKLERSEGRVSEFERSSRETESVTKQIREEKERAETQNIQLQEQLAFMKESQQNQRSLLPENERLQSLASERTAQLAAVQSELESLQQENTVLRSSQESTLSGVHEQEGKSLQLSQDIAALSRENEQSYRKLNEATKQLELIQFERDELEKENTIYKESSAQLQTLQLQHQHVIVELNALKEKLSFEREGWQREKSELLSQQSTDPVRIASLSEQAEIPAATNYYVTQLEERLQNVGYAHGQELQRMRETLEMEKLKSSQMEEALNRSTPSDGLPLPATAISEDFSCLNQSTLSECVNVLKHQLVRWRTNPKIALTRFLKGRPLPQLLLTAYFLSLHLIILISLL